MNRWLSSQLSQNDKVFTGRRFDVYSTEAKTKTGNKIQRDVIVHPGAVVILPLLDINTIIMIRNERFAIGKEIWELPAGTLEPNETPIITANRELAEETGYQCKQIRPLTAFYTSPGICNEVMYAYVAEDLISGTQALEDAEEIKVESLTWKIVLKMIQNGDIIDGKTLATLLFYHAFYSNVEKFQ